MNVYSKRGVRHKVAGASLGGSWTVCGAWTTNMKAANPTGGSVDLDCKKCFREVANHG